MTRRSLPLVVALGLLVAGCGEDAQRPTDEAGTPDAADAATATAAFPRVVVHAMGETEIDAAPERVVVLDTGELDSAIALGVTPVGAVSAPVEDGFLDYLADETSGTELVGTTTDVNLEAVAALRPDLILSSKLRHEAIYDELSAIAPTVFTETVGVAWKDNLAVHAEALGREDDADEMLSDYTARAGDLGERIAEARGSLPSVSVVRFLPDRTRLYQKASFIGTVLEDVGLPRPPAQDVDDFAAEISAEQLEMADGDIVFTTHYGPAGDTTQPALTESEIWRSLAAVEAGAVHEVADDHWMLGIGIGAAELVLDDLEAVLVA